MKSGFAVCAAVALTAVLFLAGNGVSGETPAIWMDRAVPPFSVQDIDGKEVSLAGLLGGSKALVVNFWGVRCQTCIEEMPHLGELSSKLGPKGLRVVGVNTDGLGGEQIREILPTIGVRPGYPLVCDPEFKVMDAYQVTVVPFTLVVRPDGKVSYEHLGFGPGDEKELEQAVRKLLEAPGK